MGVTNLWSVLEPVQVHQTLSSLKGQTLAVDLSIWVCETQCVKQMQGVVSKPFLRNLFFRVSHLLQLGIHLVFVIEGRAPDLKQQVMAKRQESRYANKKAVGGQRRGGRRNFNACLRECCEMLDYLGVPYVQSSGEAEATCAALNATGVVDGCLTNDGDAFLYGARTVYRNFTMNTKDPHVECYSMTDVEERLGLTREKLIAMALLLGCDYLPKGVPGVGVERVVKLMNSLTTPNVLKRFEMWKSMSETLCVDKVEVFIRRKAAHIQDFPQKEVVQEFLQDMKKCPTCVSRWSRPSMADLQVFCVNKLEWPVEYTLEKVLPLITLWDMTDISKNNSPTGRHLIPQRIVKCRVRQGVNCYEVLWNKPAADSVCSEDLYKTIEEQALFRRSYPHIVADFEIEQATKKSKGKGRKSRKKTTNRVKETEASELSEKLEDINKPENNSDDVETDEDEEMIKEDLNTQNTKSRFESVDKPDASLLNIPVTVKQQMKASPMHRLELAMRSVAKQSVKGNSVVVERNLNFSSSEEDEGEYLPLSQRLQLKITKSRGVSIHQSGGSPGEPQGLVGGGEDVMVRAISQGVSSALRDNFSSDSETEDLYTFPSHPETRNIQVDIPGNMAYNDDDLKENCKSAINVNGSDPEISCKHLETSLPGNCDNPGATSLGTPVWQQSFVNSKLQKLDKTEFLDMPKLNFTVVTPDLHGRSESSPGIRTKVSSSTPDRSEDCVSRFSHNLSNLSPHLSEEVMVSPLLKIDSLQSPIDSIQKLQGSHSMSVLWENMSFNNTKVAIDFGNFEVQTSLLNSFSKLNITEGEMSSVMNSFHEKVSKIPNGDNSCGNGEHSKIPEIKEGCSNNTRGQRSVIFLNDSDSICDGGSILSNEQTKNRDENRKDSTQTISALQTINRQSRLSKSPQIRSNKDKTRVSGLSSPVCGGKENVLNDRGEECSKHSPMSLIERLRQRLGNHTDSSIINNIKYRPLSVKPLK
ncbi:flap endonuclease GEN homolog 1-like [Saccostrea echinata]|uniref:flap endonuclease GEN homolog 1-like n=1 Tax=Saccostrea echinata TaxID=191078 RepID=UPI002A8218C7|nr:flap endonuclease GEN homolog 1-like [Saccostrea echinata]